MKLTRLILCLFLLATLTVMGCGSSDDGQQQVQQQVQPQVSFVTLKKGSVSPYDPNSHVQNSQVKMEVIRNEEDWAKLWNLLFTYSPVDRSALPSVDFNKNVAISVVNRVQPNLYNPITITLIQTTEAGVKVYAVQDLPGPDCIVYGIIDLPYHIVLTPIFSGNAELVVTQSY